MLVALASVVVDHIQQHLQTGRVQGPYRRLELGDLPAGPAGPRRGRLATADGPLPASGRSARHPHALRGEHGAGACGEGGITVPDQERDVRPAIVTVHVQMAGLLGDLLPRRRGGDPGQVPAAGAVPGDDQHGQTAQQHGTGREEVRRPDRLRRGARERPPGLPRPPGNATTVVSRVGGCGRRTSPGQPPGHASTATTGPSAPGCRLSSTTSAARLAGPPIPPAQPQAPGIPGAGPGPWPARLL